MSSTTILGYYLKDFLPRIDETGAKNADSDIKLISDELDTQMQAEKDDRKRAEDAQRLLAKEASRRIELETKRQAEQEAQRKAAELEAKRRQAEQEAERKATELEAKRLSEQQKEVLKNQSKQGSNSNSNDVFIAPSF